MKIWHRMADWFENGDLTPLAVVISVAHYGPVLQAHGEHWLVAWIVGVVVDMLHFRTIRRAVTARKWLDFCFGVVTTGMALAYHLRFYSNDWLLAAPIPMAIVILAYHASSKETDADVHGVLVAERDAAVARVGKLVAERDKLVARVDAVLAERDTAMARVDTVLAERDAVVAERDKLTARLATEVVAVDKLPPRLAAYVALVAQGVTPNGQMTDQFGIGQSTIERANKALLQ